jgi:hypothetical protein
MQSPSLLVTISYYSILSGMLGGASYIIKVFQPTQNSLRSFCAAEHRRLDAVCRMEKHDSSVSLSLLER